MNALHDRGPRRVAAGVFRACLAAGAVLAASEASADVIDLSSDGVISVRQGTGAAVWQKPDAVSETAAEPAAPLDGAAASNLLPSVPAQYATSVSRAAEAAEISPALLSALVWQESRWNARAVSPKGAIGLAQLMPDTARQLGVDPRDPAQNLLGGARYLRQLLDRFDGNIEKVLAAYNAGPARVERVNGVPHIAETQAYVTAVVQRLSSQIAGGL